MRSDNITSNLTQANKHLTTHPGSDQLLADVQKEAPPLWLQARPPDLGPERYAFRVEQGLIMSKYAYCPLTAVRSAHFGTCIWAKEELRTQSKVQL